MTKQNQPTCIDCIHFRNAPSYLENLFKGMNTMSSGHASVRKDDGICLVHDIYLSSHNSCDQFQAEDQPRLNVAGRET